MVSIELGTYSFTLGVVQVIYFYAGFQVLIVAVGQLLVFHSPKERRQQAVSNNKCLACPLEATPPHCNANAI
jgi:hypothetical protein